MGEHFKKKEEKITLGMIVIGIAIIAILGTSLIIYLLKASSNQEELDNLDDKISESTSTEIGKSVNEAKNEIINNETKSNETNITQNSTSNSISTSKKEKVVKNDVDNNVTATNINTNTNTTSNVDKTNKDEDKKEVQIKFTAPVKGEIIREFAPDSLVFSDTLEEWITHNGVDIKADKTSVITAAAPGTVTAIKNDPRYGLTVIITHEGGYKTVYANLLTAEFVVEGEEVKENQTIGTVGNSATFEITDECHLHFELLKDDEYVNPTNYMEF